MQELRDYLDILLLAEEIPPFLFYRKFQIRFYRRQVIVEMLIILSYTKSRQIYGRIQRQDRGDTK